MLVKQKVRYGMIMIHCFKMIYTTPQWIVWFMSIFDIPKWFRTFCKRFESYSTDPNSYDLVFISPEFNISHEQCLVKLVIWL